MKIACIGHSTYDITLPMDNFPKENFKYRIKNHVKCGGGPASNGAYLLAKWGMDVSIISIIGDDFYGKKILEDFKEIGANTDYLEIKNNFLTSSSYIIANKSNGSRTILTTKDTPIRKHTKEINSKFDLILIDGEHPDTACEVLENNPKAISILDAGRLNDDIISLAKKVSYIICSKDFAEEFCKEKLSPPYDNLNQLKNIYNTLKDFFNTNIIITLEANGSFTEINNQYKIIPSISVKSIDSTGAGDIFHGAFTYFIGNDYPLESAIKYASIAGAISVTRVGSRFSIPTLEEVLKYDITI